MRRSLLVKAAVTTLMFGSVSACIREMDMDSYALGVWRLSIAVVGMTAIMRRRHAMTWAALAAAIKREWRVLVAVGVFFGAHWLTYFQSIKLAGASSASLALSTGGVQIPLLGWVVGAGRPRAAAMAGVALAAIGSVLCLPEWSGASSKTEVAGFLLGILSATLYAFVPILHRRHKRLDNEIRTWAQFAFALPVFLVGVSAANWSLSLRDFWFMLYLSVAVGLIGHYLWAQISAALPLSTTSALGYLQLPTALAINYVAIHDPLTKPVLIGAGCILAGNLLALRSEKQLGVEPEPPLG